jgi:hypothetical protein
LSRLTQIAQPSTRFVFLGAGFGLGLPSHPASRRRSCLRLGVSTTSSSRGLSPPIDRPCRAYSRAPSASLRDRCAPLDPGHPPAWSGSDQGHGASPARPRTWETSTGKPSDHGTSQAQQQQKLDRPLHMSAQIQHSPPANLQATELYPGEPRTGDKSQEHADAIGRSDPRRPRRWSSPPERCGRCAPPGRARRFQRGPPAASARPDRH